MFYHICKYVPLTSLHKSSLERRYSTLKSYANVVSLIFENVRKSMSWHYWWYVNLQFRIRRHFFVLYFVLNYSIFCVSIFGKNPWNCDEKSSFTFNDTCKKISYFLHPSTIVPTHFKAIKDVAVAVAAIDVAYSLFYFTANDGCEYYCSWEHCSAIDSKFANKSYDSSCHNRSNNKTLHLIYSKVCLFHKLQFRSCARNLNSRKDFFSKRTPIQQRT